VRILLITPQTSDRTELLGALKAPGHEVSLADSGQQAAPATPLVDLIVVDLSASDSLRFIRRHRSQRSTIPLVCIADRRKPDASSEALRLGVADIVGRPVLGSEVMAAVANASEAVHVARMPAPLPELPEASEAVFGPSPAMRDVLGLVRRVAQSRCTVMVVGERGTGREMIARAIHAQGPRRDRPFTKVACADATSRDLDQVLNGRVPEGATVYLEELAELSPELQARLESRIGDGASAEWSGERDGGEPAGHGDGGQPAVHPVRFVAGALPRVADAVERGHLRGRLVDALSVVRIDLPPLRQRPHDVPLLAMHFLKQACRASDQPVKTFSRSALTLLASLPWPGNAAELRSLTERLSVLVPRGLVLLEDVLANVRLDGGEAVGRMQHATLKEAREHFEREYITAVLDHHRGRIGPAARELGIERTNLYRKMKQLKIRLQ
jgi:two-component system, NtrC family, nitrogen regulation response regulator NtrX